MRLRFLLKLVGNNLQFFPNNIYVKCPAEFESLFRIPDTCWTGALCVLQVPARNEGCTGLQDVEDTNDKFDNGHIRKSGLELHSWKKK
jgi:hypothetical protein